MELARHPWYSSYYPEPFFARHPPLHALVLGVWSLVFPNEEAWLRLPSLLLTGAATLMLTDAIARRHGETAAMVAALLLGSSFLILAYGVQATMYPIAFLLVSLGVWGNIRGRERVERWAVALLPLAHLFGFVFLATYLWQRRHAPRRSWLPAAPALVWVVAAAYAAAAARGIGPQSGMAWQFARVFEAVYESIRGEALEHFILFGLTIALLQPLILAGVWNVRSRWDPWTMAAASLLPFQLLGPGFLRYALLLVPPLWAAGVARGAGRRTGAAMVVWGLLAGSLTWGFTIAAPEHGNDIPGGADWEAAAHWVHRRDLDRLVAAAPPAVAYYLEPHGWHVEDRSGAPGRLLLAQGDRTLEVVEWPRARPLPPSSGATAFVGFDRWFTDGDLAGLQECQRTGGLQFAVTGTSCSPTA